MTSIERITGLGFDLDGFDTLVCVEHYGALDFDARVPSGDRMVCRVEDCTTRAIILN